MSDDDFERYVQLHGGRVPEGWRLWQDEQGSGFLVISVDESGKEHGHMLDDEKFAQGLAGYLRARGVKALRK